MKKIALTSLLTISIAAPALGAVGDKTINAGASSAPCTSATLDTPTGPAALEADWDANTIRINWDAKNGTTIPSGECTYDSTLTLPATPSKTGYTFGGWTVKSGPAQCSLSGLDASARGTYYGYISNDDSYSYNASTYGLTESGTWGATFSHGVVKGEALCSSTNGTYAQTGNPTTSGGGINCWCRATTYTANNADMCSVSAPAWVFNGDLDNSDNCSMFCAENCGADVSGNSAFRAALFGQSN